MSIKHTAQCDKKEIISNVSIERILNEGLWKRKIKTFHSMKIIAVFHGRPYSYGDTLKLFYC